jgi:hypothetical protein
MKPLLPLVFLLLATVGGGACRSRPLGEVDGGASKADGMAECQAPLSEVGALCPPSFDGTPEELPTCDDYTNTLAVRFCGDLIGLHFWYGYSSSACYYDGASHRLVGAWQRGDVPSYCDDTSFARSAGRTPPDSCYLTAPSTERRCPLDDAGSTSPTRSAPTDPNPSR